MSQAFPLIAMPQDGISIKRERFRADVPVFPPFLRRCNERKPNVAARGKEHRQLEGNSAQPNYHELRSPAAQTLLKAESLTRSDSRCPASDLASKTIRPAGGSYKLGVHGRVPEGF
jgi:hypothetical protein